MGKRDLNLIEDDMEFEGVAGSLEYLMSMPIETGQSQTVSLLGMYSLTTEVLEWALSISFSQKI